MGIGDSKSFIPPWSDPRWPFAGILITYLVVGMTFLGFNRTPSQILVMVATAAATELILHRILRGPGWFFPLSAMISSLGIAVLLNYSHGLLWPVFPVLIAISSKYLLTYRGRHFFNPSMFGVVMSLMFSQGMISTAASYQWGGTIAASLFVVTAALVLFVSRIQRGPLIVSFLIFYALATALRAYLDRLVIPPETLFLGTISSPSFYLFAFFMLTDPATSPKEPRTQVLVSFSVVVIDFVLHSLHMFETIFYSAFIFAASRFLFLHACDLWERRTDWMNSLRAAGARAALIGGAIFVAQLVHFSVSQASGTIPIDFHLDKISTNFSANPSSLTNEVDPRVAHLGKWLISIGDAAAVVDFDEDGLPDVFLSNSIKSPEDRGTLYRNLGGFKFEQVPLAALESIRKNPKAEGYISMGLWFDYDNDGDSDLLVVVGYGKTRLLKNALRETGRAEFSDVSRAAGLSDYTISVGANVLDFDHDGWPDLVIGNAFERFLPGYSQPQPFNAFQLPAPEYNEDRRMFNFMHRTWHDADNGGGLLFYRNNQGHFEKVDSKSSGLRRHRWNIDVGTGDLDGDGWTDLYVSNDFGPDQLFMNEKGHGFREVSGLLVGDLGRDTYKGMNSSITDLDHNGFPDIYVSNVHEVLQAEGSLLWMNDGLVRSRGYLAFKDRSVALGALNERRYGWGAAVGDLNRDGWLDIVQTNGYIDDRYDRLYEGCPDYWYWNGLVALSPPDIHGFADNWADLRGRCFFPYEQNRLYLNQGGRFSDVAVEAGLGEPNTARAAALADFDNDGNLDLIVTGMTQEPKLYRNNSRNLNAWVGVDLRGNGETCNRDALGTSVKIGKQLREVQAKNGLLAQNDRRLFFGLGPSTTDRVTVEIRWCGEAKWEKRDLEVNRYHRIGQGE